MNLILSCIAALETPIIIDEPEQTRRKGYNRMRAENDYLFNLKAEMQPESKGRFIT